MSIRLINSALTGGELVVNATYKLIYDGTYFQVVGAGTSGGSVAIGDITDWPAGVSATEVGYLDGVTSALQTQLDGKASSSHNHVPVSSGSDGNVTISGSVTLTRDMYYNNLTLATGGVLDPAQYQIFVAGTLAQTGGKIAANGNSGNIGSTGANGGGGGGGRSVGTLGIAGNGGAGATGGTGVGSAGTAASSAGVQSWGGRGASATNGGAGGAGSGGAGGAAGAAGAYTHVAPHERIAIAPRQDSETHYFVRGGAGGGGGGAGGGDGSNSGRGGGGGGAGGGMCLVFANVLDLSGASGVLIESKGGTGGNSNGAGVTGDCGGGGGGQGGGGGYIGLYCNSVIGSLSNALDVSGGNGGNGSNGAGTGIGGRGGRGGDGGNADFYRADTGVWTRARSAGAASGTAATAPSGVTGTTGGAGEVVRLSI